MVCGSFGMCGKRPGCADQHCEGRPVAGNVYADLIEDKPPMPKDAMDEFMFGVLVMVGLAVLWLLYEVAPLAWWGLQQVWN